MPRKLTDKNRLSTNHPNLPAYIDPELNDGLTADRVTSRSNKALVWTCRAAGHIFSKSPNEATRKRRNGTYQRCPMCVTLAFHSPDIAAEWHPAKNGNFTPTDVTYGSAEKRWWKCNTPECPVVDGHEWQDSVAHRTTGGRGCPACAGKVVTDKNRLSTFYPDISDEWHPTKNGDKTPSQYAQYSSKPAWWLCSKCGYDWSSIISNRTRIGAGCPACAGKVVTEKNCLVIHYPAVAEEWVRCLGCDLPANEHSFGSNHRASWRCSECEYEWRVGVADRTISGKGKGTGCPACAGKAVTDKNRLTNHPQIAAMVLPELNNGQKAYDISESSNKPLNLRCANGHKFRRSPNSIIKKQVDGTWKYRDCFQCNTVAFRYPELILEWNNSKNKGKKPKDFRKHSPQNVWWKCSNPECPVAGGHEWETSINSRTGQGTGCPACAGRGVTDENRLTILRPQVANEWTRCLDCDEPASEHAFRSNHRALWRCKLMHKWDAVINSRSSGHGCSKCNPRRSKREIRIACELAYVFPCISPNDSVRLDRLDRRRLICDIYAPTYKLVIEYDGVYWHKGKVEADIEKTNELESLGYKVLRLREVGLELLPNVHNIKCNIDYYSETGVKAVVDDVLRYIAREFGISDENTKDYLSREGLANIDLAETIIGLGDGQLRLSI